MIPTGPFIEMGSELEIANRQIRKMEAENERYLKAFRHYHVNDYDGDSCAECGLDLRDPVHTRIVKGSR